MRLFQKAVFCFALWLVVACFSTVVSAAFTIDRLTTPLVAGNKTGYALQQDGTVLAWGYDSDGRLGTGLPPVAKRLTPTPVAGLSGIIAIAGAEDHMLALRSDGTVWAWGLNTDGAVGDGTFGTVRSVPAMVAGLSNVVAIYAGGWNSFAVASDGRIYAWGRNEYGQLGINNTTRQALPVQIPVNWPSMIVQMAVGDAHTLALDAYGRLYGWGDNRGGTLGNGGAETICLMPKLLPSRGRGGWKSIGAGQSYSIALMGDGSVLGWGNGGSLGIGSWDAQFTPVPLSGLSNIKMIAAGKAHAFAVGADNRLWGWGTAANGQLGDGVLTTTPRQWPVLVSKFDEVPGMISPGVNSTLAVTRHGEVYAWGRNADAQLGLGTSGSGVGTPTKTSLHFIYKILVLAISQSGTLDLNPAAGTPTEMARVVAGVKRMSYERVLPRVDYFSHHATASQIGCLGEGGDGRDDERQTIYGLQQAALAGINVASYQHLFILSDYSLSPDCDTAGGHGGIPGPGNPLTLSGLVKPDTGLTSLAGGMNAGYSPASLVTHEFLHAYANFGAHEGVMTCPLAVSPSYDDCNSDDWAASGMYALGGSGYIAQTALDGSSPTTENNESAGQKWMWGWLGPSSVVTPSPCGSQIRLIPMEATANPSIGSYYYAATLPNAGGWITVEYRKFARIGPNFSNRPGVYASFLDNRSISQSHVLNLQTETANWGSTAPLSIGVAYQLGDNWIRVNSLGVDAQGVERADITAWANSSLCVK